MKQNNPFVIVGYNGPEYFCDREKDTAKLLAAIENDRNVTLIAPRRYGKTGLLHHVNGMIPRDYAGVYLDIFALKNLTDDLKEVCLGYYAHRDTDNVYRGRTCVCKVYDPNGVKYFNYPLESEYTAEELKELRDGNNYKVRIHGGGMGCAFIKTELFQRLDYP